MQHVKREWLTIYNWFLIILDAIIFGAYIIFNSPGKNPSDYAHWGITPLILAVAALHAIYALFIFPFVRKKSEWLGSLISFAIFLFLWAALIETSQFYNIYIRLGYAFFVFSTALIGPFLPTASIISTWVFCLYTFLNILTSEDLSLRFELTVNTIVTICGISGYLFLKRFYIAKKDRETIALSRLLKQEQFKSNVILESITDGVMVISTKGTVQVLNESAATMLGWEKQEALQLDYRSLIKPLSNDTPTSKNIDTNDIIQQALVNKKAAQGVMLLQTKNGRQLFVDIVVSPIMETLESKNSETTPHKKQLVGVIAVLRDVDEQKRQEQERSEFISTASHEMRTPVATIQGFLDLMITPKIWQDKDKVREYIEKARAQTQHLGELFHDLLSVSQSEENSLPNNPETFDINDFLKQIITRESHLAEQKGLKISADFMNSTHKTMPIMQVSVDPQRLEEVVQNLFENAVKYTKEGGITLKTTVEGEYVRFSITDTGLGIAAEDIPHLFQKFYRTDNSATREIGGTGLGLYICKQIVEMMGGKIWVESTPGAGSTFFVEIPRVHPEAQQGTTT